jgi:hypothetical protein
MRSLVRIVAPVLAAVAIVLAGSSSALASSKAPRTWSPPPASAVLVAKAPRTWAPPPASAPLVRDSSPGWAVDDAWCNGDAAFMTCFEVKGRVQYALTDRTSSIVINVQQTASHYEAGVLVAEDTEVSHLRFADSGNGTFTTHSVTHLRINDGDVTCSFQETFRIVNGELQTSHDAGTCV